MAYAMANAALLIDDDCQCAKLVKAGATSAAAIGVLENKS